VLFRPFSFWREALCASGYYEISSFCRYENAMRWFRILASFVSGNEEMFRYVLSFGFRRFFWTSVPCISGFCLLMSGSSAYQLVSGWHHFLPIEFAALICVLYLLLWFCYGVVCSLLIWGLCEFGAGRLPQRG
jgi:hypothetical protein